MDATRINLTVAAALAVSGVFIALLSVFVDSQWMVSRRARADKPAKIEPSSRRFMVVSSSIVSTGMIFAAVNLAPEVLFRAAPAPWWRVPLEAAAILLVYDFGYYLLHRFAFHVWEPGMRMHAVHHRVRTPFARDSLYVHPLETAGGVGLLLLSVVAVGPVTLPGFGLAFLVYSLLNVFIHSAFHVPHPVFAPLNAMARNHDTHHASMRGGYYGSITPVWDLLFRTARS